MNPTLVCALMLSAAGSIMACAAPGDAVVETPGAFHTLTAVDRAVLLARALRQTPYATDSILSAYGMSRAGFDSLMYGVATDPGLARAYAAARP